MTQLTTRLIREEHGALAALLRAIPPLLAGHRRAGTVPDLGALRALLFYLDEFPEKRHHRLESQLLFAKLRSRSPWIRPVLDRLDQDHLRGEYNIRQLAHLLLRFEMLGEPCRDAFEQAAQRYVSFYLEHMRVEERDVLPVAEQVLGAEDWAELDTAFSAHRDPLAGGEPEPDYRALFRRIAHGTSLPVGLVPATTPVG